MAAALKPVAVKQVVATTRRAADRALAGKKQIEVVRGLTDEVLKETIGVHLGTGKISPEQLEAARMVFRHIFINPFNSPDVVDAAKLSAAQLLDHVRDIVAARRAEVQRGRDDDNDVLARLMYDMAHAPADQRLKDDDELADQLVGLVVAWAAPVSRATAYAIDALLDRPAALEQAHKAAERDDETEMWKVLAEAIRVQPPVPAVERLCLREGPVEQMPVTREQDVSIVLTAVTMDEGQYKRARRFNAQRDDDQQDNLGFGYDLHRCLGFELASRQMSQITIALMKRHRVRRAGKLHLAGPYPDRLEVTFEAL